LRFVETCTRPSGRSCQRPVSGTKTTFSVDGSGRTKRSSSSGNQNQAASHELATAALETCFGPETRRRWEGLHAFREGRIPCVSADDEPAVWQSQGLHLAFRTMPGIGGPCDDRIYLDQQAGLVALADARGPTYGGWHEPIRVEAGWQAMRSAWRKRTDLLPAERMDAALVRANSAMFDPTRRPTETDFATQTCNHTTASFTVLGFADGEVAIGQVGSGRAYRYRESALEMVARDHTVGQRPMRATAQLLGYCPTASVDIRVEELELGDMFLLCSEGLWDSLIDAEIEQAFTGRGSPSTIVASLSGRAIEKQAWSAALVVIHATSQVPDRE